MAEAEQVEKQSEPGVAFSSGRAVCMPIITPKRLMRSSRSTAAQGASSSGELAMMPALLNRMSSRPPVCSAKAAAAARKSLGSATSRRRAKPIRPSPSSVRRPSSSTSNAPTNHPRSANSSAVARPIPEAAPVMKMER